jgi:hypothetical protein
VTGVIGAAFKGGADRLSLNSNEAVTVGAFVGAVKGSPQSKLLGVFKDKASG